MTELNIKTYLIFICFFSTNALNVVHDVTDGDLRGLVAALLKDSHLAREQITELQARTQQLESKNDEQERLIRQLQAECTGPVKSIRRQMITESPVAFYAYMHDHVFNMGPQQPAVFDTVYTNEGNAYNSHAGLFIAPVSGLYVFSVSLISYPRNTGHYSIVKNNAQVGLLYLHHTSEYQTSSQTIVIRLKHGDDVAVHNVDGNTTLHGGPYTSFTGFLLYEMDDQPNVIG